MPSFHKVSSSTGREGKGGEEQEEIHASPVPLLCDTTEGAALHIWP